MGAAGGFHHAAHQVALEGVEAGLGGVQFEARLDPLGGHVAGVRRPREEVVEVGVGAGDQGVAEAVGDVHMQDRRVQLEGRHRQQGLAVGVGRLDGLQLGVEAHHVGGQAAAGRQEGQAHAGGAQAPLEHALVQLHQLEAAALADLAVPGLQRDGVEGGEAEDQLLHLAGGAQHADLGAAIGHHGEVLELGAEDLAHDGHGLAPGAPAPEADGHAVAQAGDDIRRRHLFVHVGSLLGKGCGVAQAACCWPALKSWPQMLTRVNSKGLWRSQSTCRPPQPNSRSKPDGVFM